MKINLNDPSDFTLENVKKLIASGDDSIDTQFRVTTDGFLFISTSVGTEDLDGILFRLESNVAFNGWVGKDASEDEEWVERIFEAVKKNWPSPNDDYIDDF